ncbi:MAG TPA: folate-binding protein [Casimicrobiaceae bacterium]|nr:folate-binding protein [Casimicrobiaceae bacterium]
MTFPLQAVPDTVPQSPPQAWQAAERGAVFVVDTDLAAMAIRGPDAPAFLQGQFSNDVKALPVGHGQWTTYNSPKGRMLATLFLVRSADDAYDAILAADIAQAVRKRLAMFVLRSKVTIADETEQPPLIGIGGPDAVDSVTSAFGSVPDAGGRVAVDDVSIMRWPDGRVVIVAPRGSSPTVLQRLEPHATPAGNDVWRWLLVRSGVPMITAATQDRFVAQTANLDVVGALDFKKGCYTGQEVVARTHYLGRLKERLFSFATDADAPDPGTRLYGVVFGDQASGTVVNSARDRERGAIFLAVAHLEAVDKGPMRIGAVDGPEARVQPLPYTIPPLQPPRGRMKP